MTKSLPLVLLKAFADVHCAPGSRGARGCALKVSRARVGAPAALGQPHTAHRQEGKSWASSWAWGLGGLLEGTRNQPFGNL